MLCALSKCTCTHYTMSCNKSCVMPHPSMHIRIMIVISMQSDCLLFTNFHRTDAIGDCTNKATSCMAAYYSKNERPPPAECSRRNKCAGITGERLDKCIRKWGKCVKDAFKDQYGKVHMSLI